MKSLMTSQVGIFRKESDLLMRKGEDQGVEREDFERLELKQKDLAFNYEFIQYLELEGMLHLGRGDCGRSLGSRRRAVVPISGWIILIGMTSIGFVIPWLSKHRKE